MANVLPTAPMIRCGECSGRIDIPPQHIPNNSAFLGRRLCDDCILERDRFVDVVHEMDD